MVGQKRNLFGDDWTIRIFGLVTFLRCTAMRPVISYDDITLPYKPETSSSSSSRPPPNKKRKWYKQPSHQRVSKSTTLVPPEATDPTAQVEGRELTHEDIWDDSALIAAWDAATEEYEAYNGPEKGWKMESVHKSSL